MKKKLSVILASAMIISSLAGCSSQTAAPVEADKQASATNAVVSAESVVPVFEDDLSETVHFTVCTTQTRAAGDYTSDPLAQFISEKFNVTWEAWPVAKDSFNEKVRVWVSSGSMPTMTTSQFNLSEYYDYVDQGLLAPLPEGWEELYPNLYEMAEKTNLLEYLTVDGSIYAIPHAVFGRFANFDPITNHNVIFYRKDWAAELGYNWTDTVTMSEFKSFLKECIDKDMSGTGKTYGLTSMPDFITNFFMTYTGVDYDGFVETGDGMEWGPNHKEVPEMIKTMREWYKEGIIHPDYFSFETAEAHEYFNNGYSAATYRDGVVGVYGEYDVKAKNNGWGDDSWDSIIVTDDEGKVYASETTNYSTVTLFNPDNDELTMHRVLAMTDWLCTEEGVYTLQMGIKGTEWDLDENGQPYMLEAALEGDGSIIPQMDRHNSYRIWRQLGWLSDDFNFVSPAYKTELQDRVRTMYGIKSKADVIIPHNLKYTTYSSETKNIYSVNILDAVTKLVINDEDIDTAWTTFIDENKGLWKPLLDELNEAY